MPIGQAYAGSRLTGLGLRAAAPLSAYKGANQSSTNSTTLFNDNALFLPLLANAVYDFELVIGYTGGTLGSSDIKLAWTLPSGATVGYTIYGSTTSGNATDAPWVTGTSAQALGSAGASTPVGAVLSGTVATSTTAGTMQLQWAKNSTGVSTVSTVLAGSVLLAWQVQ